MSWPTIGQCAELGIAPPGLPRGIVHETHSYDGFDGLAEPQRRTRLSDSASPQVPPRWWLLGPAAQFEAFAAESARVLRRSGG